MTVSPVGFFAPVLGSRASSDDLHHGGPMTITFCHGTTSFPGTYTLSESLSDLIPAYHKGSPEGG